LLSTTNSSFCPMNMYTTSTSNSTEVIPSFASSRSLDSNGSDPTRRKSDAVDDALTGFMPDFSLMERMPNDDERSIGFDSTVLDGKYHDALGSGTKTCMPGGFFWRSKASRKVHAQDVASVAASDTMISVCSKMRMSGRDLHEAAKASLNAGELKKSLSFFESLREAQVKRFGQMHPSVGAAIHNVAVVHMRMNNHEEAEKLFAEAVAIRKETLGTDQLEVAASLSKLGSTRVALGKYDDALADLREAHRIACYKVGHQHKTVAQTLCNMAYLYFQAEELLAAEATFRDALDIYRAVWSHDSDRDSCMAQLTDTLCNIGSILNKRKKYSGAIVVFKEALDVSCCDCCFAYSHSICPHALMYFSQLQRGVMGHDHPRVIATLDNMGFSYSKNKDYAAALSVSRDEERKDDGHYSSVGLLSHYGPFVGSPLSYTVVLQGNAGCSSLPRQYFFGRLLRDIAKANYHV
jgi:tetratricopeptide (TPR) repeat protein